MLTIIIFILWFWIYNTNTFNLISMCLIFRRAWSSLRVIYIYKCVICWSVWPNFLMICFSFNIPRKFNESSWMVSLSCIKRRPEEWWRLCEDICNLIFWRKKLNKEIVWCNLIPNKMVINGNMIGVWVEKND